MYHYCLMIKPCELLKFIIMNSPLFRPSTLDSSEPNTRTIRLSRFLYIMDSRFYLKYSTHFYLTSNLQMHYMNIQTPRIFALLSIMIQQMTILYILIHLLPTFPYMMTSRTSMNFKLRPQPSKILDAIEQQFTQLNLLKKTLILLKKKSFKVFINMSHQVITQFL